MIEAGDGTTDNSPAIGDAVDDSVTGTDTPTETAPEQPPVTEETKNDNKETESNTIKNEDEQLLEDDSIENHGGLDGAALSTVTVWESVNARAYRVAIKDIPKPEEEDFNKENNTVPLEVQEFLDAVAALPEISTITQENAEEIGEQVNEVINLWEMLDEEFSEREDVIEAMETVYAIFEAVLEAAEIEEGRPYLAQIPNLTPADRFYDNRGKEVAQLYVGTYPKNPVYKYTNPETAIKIKVGETGNEDRKSVV